MTPQAPELNTIPTPAMTYPTEFLCEIALHPPCGEDLTYQPEFMAMEASARGKTEQQFGDTVIAAEAPDWRMVERQASALMERTKDLRVVAVLCRAWTNLRGLVGTAQGLQLTADLLERYWTHLHPLPEDETDHYMRMNAVAVLGDVTGLVRELRDTEFLRATFGSVRVREAEALARGHGGESNGSVSPDQLRAAVAEAWTRGAEPLRAVTLAAEALARTQALCASKLPTYQLPELDALQGLLQTLQDLLPKVHDPVPAEAQRSDDVSATAPGQVTPRGHGFLRDREDAIHQLLRIAEFVEQSEPTNPAPLLIHRAVKLMRMNFMDILRELSPASLAQVEVATGVRPDA